MTTENYVQVTDKSDEPEVENTKEDNGQQEKMYGEMPMMEDGYYSGPISFSELQAEQDAMEAAAKVEEMSYQFPKMVKRIFHRSDIEDKEAALSTLAEEFSSMSQEVMNKELDEKAVWTTAFVNNLPDSAFLYIQPGGQKDNEGKTKPRNFRHFPYKDASGKVDLPHLRNAIARIPQSNAPGLSADKKRQLQDRARKMLESANKSWFDNLVNTVKEAIGIDKKQQPEDSGIMFWKEADGTYHWIARYSNNFRDHDNPPEIIAAKSHQRFVEIVDKGQAPLPELWLWHIKEWKWGQADWVAYDDSGFPIAGGHVDKGCEPLAEQIMELSPELVRVSHGMPKKSIRYDDDDPSIIIEHTTKEISPLPAWAAANDLTGFELLSKEGNMAIPEGKRKTLQEEWNLSPDTLDRLEATNAASKEAAEEAGLQSKENDEQTPPPAQEETPAVEQKPIGREELVAVVTAIGEQMTAISQAVQSLAGEVKEIKEAKAAKDEETLTDLFSRAIGHEQARIDGRSSLAKQGPKETPPDEVKKEVIDTGNPMVDGLVNALVTGSWLQGGKQQ